MLRARNMKSSVLILAPLVTLVASSHAQPVPRLKTRWTDQVSHTLPLNDYPRPQMVRKNWVNLNGPWEFSVGPKADYSQRILVPFPVESYLSGLMKPVGKNDQLWYRRTFTRPKGDRVLLHFGASDFVTEVLVNGHQVGHHSGGYDPFTFDITDSLTSSGQQGVSVRVTDPTDAGAQPRGKQVSKPGGIFYTSTSGIWQTVWLEAVAKSSIDSLKIGASGQSGLVQINVAIRGPHGGLHYYAEILDGHHKIQSVLTETNAFNIKLDHPKIWSPESPFLYNLNLRLLDGTGKVIDSVASYVGLRDVKVQRDSHGVNRITLNGKPCFMVGPLDQGFWPDGLYTAPTDAALKFDIEQTKAYGFNMIRKHVKVEPDRWYYWCDRMGMLVWQDMPSGDGFIGPNDPDLKRSKESSTEYEKELTAMITALRNHPSIVTWIPFNEGWGQYDTARITGLIKHLDPSRLVDSTTGWADRKVGDVIDWHVYPGPGSPKPEQHRAAVLGEFGGLGLPLPGHTWQKEGWGYRSYKDQAELTEAGDDLFTKLRFLIAEPGLSAAVYTQTSDVETEVNGLMTYDREIIKMDASRIRRVIRDLFRPATPLADIVPTSQFHAQTWKYISAKPEANWPERNFDDSSWSNGKGGFGTKETPGAIVGTLWESSDIWLRRSVVIPTIGPSKKLFLNLHHDDDVQIYLDGKLIFKSAGYVSGYTLFAIPPKVASGIVAGTHLLAVHCHQYQGGQFIDVGFKAEK